MTMPPDDDDTSAGRITQGGSPDAGAEGPARRSGNSFLWFAVVLLIVAAVAVVWLTNAPHKDAPAERGTAPISGTLTGGAGAGPAAGSPGTPPAR